MSKYRRNFIRSAIIKLDFYDNLPLNKELPQSLIESALKNYPIFEPKPFIHKKYDFSNGGMKEAETSEGTAWIFHGKNREKSLTIEQASIGANYSRYSSFNELKSEFFSVLDKINELYPEVRINRSGLRYINSIELDEKNPINWSKYLNSNLLSIFRIPEDKKIISRAFHNLELKYDDMSIRFQYGMHNPDYPSIIRKKVFILDFDAYISAEHNINEVPANIDRYHDKIEQLFENSIKDGLRAKMNE